MVLRDEQGQIIFTACTELLTCDNGVQAELEACREDLALERTKLPIMVKMDSIEAVSMLMAHCEDRSQHRVLVEEIRRVATAVHREISFTPIIHSQNKVSHALAAYGLSTPHTMVWLCSGLDFIVNLPKAHKPP